MYSLKKNCLNLKRFLTHETYSDIDGLDLFLELKISKEVLQINENSPINVLNYIKRLESFLNACIAFRILLTIPVTVAFAEISFSKLKLIKSYLRLTMSQERLSGLVILSIKKEMLAEFECKNLISNFASQKARKINLIENYIYEFIIKYHKRPNLKLSPRAPKFIEPALHRSVFS